MSIIIKILICIGILVLLILVVALFVKKSYTVVRSITIKQSKAVVFDYVRMMKNQQYYSKWVMADPNLRQSFKGTDGTEGFYTAWESALKNVGKGEQTMTKITGNERIDYDIHFIKPFEGRASSEMQTNAIGAEQTKVTWSFNSKMPYPFNIMCLFMNMEEMIGKDIATSLSNLKTQLEK